MKNYSMGLVVLVPMLVLLPGCNFFGSRNSVKTEEEGIAKEGVASDATGGLRSDVLLMIEGKPAITVAQYEAYLEDIVKMQPQFKQVLAMMPRAERELCQNYQIEVIVEKWIEKNGIDKSAAYQEDLKRGMDLVKRQLALKYYQEEYPKRAKVDVGDDQARAWYDENKDNVPPLILSRGGVSAQMVSFDKADEAQSFYDKVKGSPASFDSAAKEAKLSVKSLKDVGPQSMEVDGAVREKLTQVKNFPSVELVKSNGKTFVVKAISKEPSKYRPFDTVKDDIKQQLRMQELFTKGIENIKKEMKVVENTKYFDEKEKQCEADLGKLREEAMKDEQAQGEAPKNGEMPMPAGQTAF